MLQYICLPQALGAWAYKLSVVSHAVYLFFFFSFSHSLSPLSLSCCGRSMFLWSMECAAVVVVVVVVVFISNEFVFRQCFKLGTHRSNCIVKSVISAVVPYHRLQWMHLIFVYRLCLLFSKFFSFFVIQNFEICNNSCGL